MKRPSFVVATASAITTAGLLLCACGASHAAAAARHPVTSSVVAGGIVTYAEPVGVNPNYIFPVEPAVDETPQILEFMPLMYQTLWSGNFDQPTYNFRTSIAEAPVWNKSDTEVTVSLRHYQWSNGTPVTARDVTFFDNLALGAGPNWADYIPGGFPYNIKRTQILTPSKLRFYLDAPYNPTYFLDNDIGEITPLPQNVWDRESLHGPVGNFDETLTGAKKVWNFLNTYAENTGTYTSTNEIWGVIDGPYKLESFGGSSSPDIFVPNPHYSGHRSTISEFEELPFTSDAAEYDELRSGGLTWGYVPSEDAPTLGTVRSDGYTVTPLYNWGVDFIVPNLRIPVLNQLYIRQALQHLVDQSQMIKSFMAGYGIPSYGPVPIYPLGNPFADSFEKHDQYPYSVAAAEKLLSEHGWKVVSGTQTCQSREGCGKGVPRGTKLQLPLLFPSGVQWLTSSNELFQADAARAHVTITLKTEAFSSVVGIITGCNPKQPSSPQCTWSLGEYEGWGYFPDIYPTGTGLFSPGSFDAGNYNNPTVDKLLSESAHGTSLAPFYQYENIVTRQLPMIGFPNITTLIATSSNLHGSGLVNEFGNLSPNLWYFTK